MDNLERIFKDITRKTSDNVGPGGQSTFNLERTCKVTDRICANPPQDQQPTESNMLCIVGIL